MIIHYDGADHEYSVSDNSYRYRTIMGENALTLYFSIPGFVEIPVGAYVDFLGERYSLMVPQNFKKHGTRNFEYILILDSAQSLLGKYKFKDTGSKRLKFSLTAKPIEHLQMIVDNLNQRDAGWTVGSCIDATEKVLSYNHDFCANAIKMISEAFETEWEIIGKAIHLRKIEYNKTTPLALSYGRGNGFKPGVGRSNVDNAKPVEILFVQGGDRNIDKSTYGSTELLLPISQTLVYEGRTYITDADGLSIRRQDRALSSHEEDSKDLSNIYPSRIGTVTSVDVIDAEKNLYDFIDSTIPETMDYKALLVAGQTMTVIFQTGMLTTREFDVQYSHSDHRFKLVPQELDGQPMPNEIYKPAPGDEYVVYGISLPAGYICDDALQTGASWDMFREAAKYLFENEDPRFNFTGELDGIWASANWSTIGPKIKLGGFVLFSDAQFQAGVSVRISAIKDFINDPHRPIIDLSNLVIKGTVTSKLHQIEENKVAIEKAKDDSIAFAMRQNNVIIDFKDDKLQTNNIVKDNTIDTRMLNYDAGTPQFSIEGAIVQVDPVNPNQITIGAGAIISHHFNALNREGIAAANLV